ncbi:serine/threonine protein kinase [Oscillatoriales cyanobacterium USR001]|nr:serine/threonine protein kinase [Oscillatoriales cyanobacterium USR001]
MSLPRPVSDTLIDLLKPIAQTLGERLGATATGQSFTDASSGALALRHQVKKDRRWIQAQIQFLQRQELRKQELRVITSVEKARAKEIKEEELRDRQEISKLCRELMRELQAEAIKVKLNEIQVIWDRDTWFSNLSRQETEQILQQQKHRLLLLVSPVKISKDCPESFIHNLNIELPAKLRSFLSQHYPQHSETCPVQFYGDYFKQPISDIDVERLQTILGPVPTAILYSDISDYEVNFHVGFWGMVNQNVSLVSIQAWNWEKVYEQLGANGQDDKVSLRIIRQIIVSIHKLLAGFLADLYYLSIDPNYEPQLDKLKSEFVQEWFAQEWVEPYIESLKVIQKQQQLTAEVELRRLADKENRAKFQRDILGETERKRKEKAQAEYNLQEQSISKVKIHNWQCVYTMPGHSSFVNSIAISPDGMILASGSWDRTIKLWNVKTGELITTLTGHSDRVNSVAISPDGMILASGSSDETIKLWNLSGGDLICTLPGHSIGVNSVAISPDGRMIASCGGSDHTIKLWNIATGKLLRTMQGHLDDVNAVIFSPDGKLLASGSSDATSKVWDVVTGELQRTLSGLNLGVNSIAISPDGQILASVRNDYTIKLRSLPTGRLMRILSNHQRRGNEVENSGREQALHILRNYVGRGNSVAISPDGLTLVSGSDDNNIKIWNMATGQLINNLKGHSGTVYSVAIAQDGKLLVSGSGDETIKIWRRD